MADAGLEARGLSLGGGHGPRLKDISIAVEPGEILAVAGANGAGKTTLLRTLAGALRPTAGEVWLNGRRLPAWTRTEQAQRRAVMSQSHHLEFPYTVEQVVALGRIPHGEQRSSRAVQAVIAEVLERLDLGFNATTRYTELSAGEQQRVQLARAACQVWLGTPDRRRYVLLDEPTANLDLAHQPRVLRFLRDLAATGVGVFWVLHDLNLGTRFADRVVLMRQGQVVACGPPATTLTPSLLQATFGVEIRVHEDGAARWIATAS
ncbi:MAG: heme ABC transporter ATP-binding protein [Pseudomonadota bacterium]|nr:heme ABC transporter ATP-binding protein [Pseudomonadota bacterium]